MVKKVVKYVFLFFIILIFNLICSPLNLDEVWNYGFANNIYRGLVPYADFNMVITPFYPWFMSLPFHIFGSSMLVFHITNAFILTGCLFLLEKMYQDKMWIFFLFFFFPVTAAAPNYSIFLFVLLVILVFLEKNYVSRDSNRIHYFIGFLLGIAVLTKQTVGVFLLVPSLVLFWKNWKVLGKRFLGFLIPITIFLIYLFVTDSFFSFINLCLLGLFDFTENSRIFNIFGLLFLFMVLVTIYFLWKDKKNIIPYYVLCFYTIVIPIIDIYHFFIAFVAFLLLFLSHVRKTYFHYSFLSIIVVFLMGILLANFNQFNIKNYPNDLNRFQYRYVRMSSYQFTKEVFAYVREHDDKNIMYMVPDAYYFKIILDQDCGYFDLINQGNLGYRGSQWLLNKIKNMEDTLFLIDPSEYGSGNQIDQKALQYILDYGTKIDEVGFYEVYVLEEE